MNPQFEELEPKQTWDRKKIGLGALVAGLLLVVVGVASSTSAASDEGQLKRQTAIAHQEDVTDAVGLPESSVQEADYSLATADMPQEFLEIRADIIAKGWNEILVCGNSLGANFFWHEFNGGLSGLVNAAQSHLYFVRLYQANGNYVQSRNYLAANSVYMNVRSNNHINEVGKKWSAAQVSAYLDKNYIYKPASMKNYLTFNAQNQHGHGLSTKKQKLVYWANGNSGGLHIHKAAKVCVWNWGNRSKRGNVDQVFMFVKRAVCS